MPDTFALRPLTLDDAVVLAPMLHAYAAEVGTIVADDPKAVRHRLQGPNSNLGRDSVGATVNSRLVGTINFQHTEEARLWGFVDAAFRRQGIGTALMSWGVQRARSEPRLAEVFAGTSSLRADAQALYRRFGFVPARTFNEMAHSDPGAVAPPPWPPGVTIRGDLNLPEAVATAVAVTNRAFVDHWDFREVSSAGMAHEIGEPGAGPGLSFFAYLDGRAVAMCRCRLHGANGFVNELGTDPTARRRGIAAALLRHAMAEMAKRGATRVELDVDADNPTGATRVYEAAGMKTVTAFSIFELKLQRAGFGRVEP